MGSCLDHGSRFVRLFFLRLYSRPIHPSVNLQAPCLRTSRSSYYALQALSTTTPYLLVVSAFHSSRPLATYYLTLNQRILIRLSRRRSLFSSAALPTEESTSLKTTLLTFNPPPPLTSTIHSEHRTIAECKSVVNVAAFSLSKEGSNPVVYVQKRISY